MNEHEEETRQKLASGTQFSAVSMLEKRKTWFLWCRCAFSFVRSYFLSFWVSKTPPNRLSELFSFTHLAT